MKTLFIPAKSAQEVDLTKLSSLNLPKNIAIIYSIQYKNLADTINQVLSKKHRVTKFTQLLGCTHPEIPKVTQAILLISSGKFHAIALASETNIPVYVFESGSLTKITKEEIRSFRKKKKANYMQFLNAKKVGIIISTKPGQENMKEAIALKKKLKNKDVYLFISNEINSKEFENFKMDAWINTACPRLDLDSSIINLADLDFCHTKHSF